MESDPIDGALPATNLPSLRYLAHSLLTRMPTRPIGIQLLAALLTIYTIGGFVLAGRVAMDQDERYRWWLIAVAAAVFAVVCGVSALTVWRLERRAPMLLVACGAVGSAVCLALPAAAPPEVQPPGMWRAAIQGAILILAFLVLAAWYVRNVLRRGSSA